MPGASSPPPAAETRKLAAIMFTDIVGFSRQMGVDEPRMLRLLDVHNDIIQQAVAAQHGHVIKTIGDAFLVDFPSVVSAVQCAQQIQQQFKTYNAGQNTPEQIHLRIGIHLGDIVQKDGDVFGDGVNIASRLQALAEPDTICLSEVVYKEVAKKLELSAVISLGRPKLKNIAERFRVYALLTAPSTGFSQKLQIQRLKLSRRLRPAPRLAIAGLLLIAATAGVVQYFRPLSTRDSALRTPAALPLPDKPSLAVMPFVNMSNDPEQEYFSDGITEDITTDLSKISSLFVIARNSAFSYKGKSPKVQDVSRELGVRYVLEGSVRRSDNQVRVTAQLVDATTGEHLWAERYDRPLKDIFAVQDELRQKIVLALKVNLTPEEQARFRRAPTDNLEAYDFYLRGGEAFFRAYYERKKEANTQARQQYTRATELDQRYAGAYTGLGMSYFLDWFYQWNRDRAQSLERAFELGQQAVALEDSLSLPHQLLGQVYLWKKQHDQAITEAERAIALDPNSADSYANLGNILINAGRPEEAIALIERAMRLNPRYPPWYLLNLGSAYRETRRYEEALTILKKVLALNPNFGPAHLNLAACYAELGRLEEAQAEVAEVLRLNPSASLEVWRQTVPYKNPADLERFLAALRKAGLK